MGSNGSKPNGETSVVVQKKEADICDNSDPRSPTPEVSRTPLHNKTGSKHTITKNVDLRKTFENATEEKLIHNNPILSAVIKNHLQSYDPRSPSQDFERTPIVISTKVDQLKEKKKIQKIKICTGPDLKSENDENCDSCTEANELSPELIIPRNLCEGFYDMSLNESETETSEPLGSSTASNEAIKNNMSNGFAEEPKTLLETNFEYIEANDKFEDNLGGCSLKSEAYEKKVLALETGDIDPRSPSIGIERTPIVLPKTEGNNCKDNVEDMSDDSLIKVLQNTNAELRQTKSLDKKSEELLIYEDEITNMHDTPKKSKSASNSGSRTPLSCMKNKDADHARSKSANMLYDPKKGSNIPKRVSHIPRLKSLSKPNILPTVSSISLKNITKASSICGDCENTPPHSHRDKWDKDNSIVL